MNRKDQWIWGVSISFLSVFRSLKYDRVPLNTVLFRDFQRFCKKQYRHIPKAGVRLIPTHRLHRACEPFFTFSDPKKNLEGSTLVRADMYPVTAGMKKQSFIYLAHSKKEYEKMKKNPDCRPLYLFKKIKPAAVNKRERIRVMNQLSRIYRSSKTPRIFKTPLFRRWMSRKLTKTMIQIARVHRIFSKNKIKQTLYGSTLNQHGSVVSSFAQSRSIPAINLQHGIFGTFGHIPANANWNIVWGKSHARFLINHGVPMKKIKIAGPYFARSLNAPKGSIHHKHPEKNTDLHVLVATQPVGLKINRKLFDAVETAASRSNLNISIQYKLHPDQRNANPYRKWIKRKTSTVVPHGTVSLQHLLNHSDLIITPFSTVGYEALTLNKPVFFYGKKRNLYYVKKRPVCFQTSDELVNLINDLRTPAKKKMLMEQMQLIDSSKRPASANVIWKAIANFRKEDSKSLVATKTNVEADSDHSGESGIERVAKQEQEAAEWQTAHRPYD